MSNKNKTDELIQQNNTLRKQLTAENERYYTDLLLYLRTAGLFYDQEEVELRLMEILQDMLEAQDAGISARTYFSKEPQAIANQLIVNFPKAGIQEKLKTFSLIFGISSFFSLINQLSPETNQINLLPFILNGLLIFLGIQGVFLFIHSDIYSRRPEDKRKTTLIIALLSILFFSLFIGIQFLKPEALFFSLPNFVLVVLTFLFPILFTGFTFLGNKKWRSLSLSVLPYIWILSSIYFLQKYNLLDFQSNQIAKYGLGIILFLSFLWSQYILLLEDKQVL